MIYKDFQDIKISALAMGAMRLPVVNNNDNDIDEVKTQEMVDYAMANGVNYYDTAWGYHGGNSEIVMGKALRKHPRESFYLATKFPGYSLSNMGKVEEIFEKQLEKCGVDYFDFYLFHNVCEMNIDAYLNRDYGTFEYLMKQKENGRIHHLGFSAHGSVEVMTRFLNEYGKHMEFCQIQLNYLDWTFQNGEAKVELLREHNIPIWIMEPVRGGRLAKLADYESSALSAIRPDEKPVALAFRFLQSIPEVVTILSGMSDYEQIKENISTFETDKPLTRNEIDALLKIADKMLNSKTVPCTSCRYCTSYCPNGLDIPSLLALYNEHNFSEGGFLAPMAIAALPEDKRPNACIACRSCEAVCPQQIKISEALGTLAEL